VAPGSVTVGAFEPTDHPCAQHTHPTPRTPAYHIAPDPQLCHVSPKYSFDPERSDFSAFIYQLSSQGLKMDGDPGRSRPEVRTLDLAAKPHPLVVLTDCPTPAIKWDAHEGKTGKDVSVAPPSGMVPSPYRTTVQVINDEGHWGVSKITTDASRRCSE
jgi:hypothetical protein